MEVELPLRLDNELLTQLLRDRAFIEEGDTITLIGKVDDCTYLGARSPVFTTDGGRLKLRLGLGVRLGSAVGDSCLAPVQWRGYLELIQKPVLAEDGLSLAFQTLDTTLYEVDGQPAQLAGVLWNFAKPRIIDYLNGIRIDLSPPVQDLRSFLGPLFPEDKREQTAKMLASIRPGRLTVEPAGLRVLLKADVQEVYNPGSAEVTTDTVASEELQLLLDVWETWDALLVELIITMAGRPLSPQDHDILVDVLLETRYVFSTALAEERLAKDFVRTQFVAAWEQLAPIFRRQLSSQPSENSLGYLAFFTAADALSVFDTLGPTLGIEISTAGLQRLAEMLIGSKHPLPYSRGVDRRLREFLRLTPRPPPPPQSPGAENVPNPVSRFLDNLIPSAVAADLPTFKEILQWRVAKNNIDGYVKRVRKVLDNASQKVLAEGRIPRQHHRTFTRLVNAVAWQESCFRQFVVKDQELTYLLSYNNTSVGLMQVHERVWRGLYNQQRLRWDIHYNALAGCEIADLYLHRYILPAKDKLGRLDSKQLARLVYAMYNGGPSQLKKFSKRKRSGNFFKSDLLFAEKFSWVSKGKWGKIHKCLVGG